MGYCAAYYVGLQGYVCSSIMFQLERLKLAPEGSKSAVACAKYPLIFTNAKHLHDCLAGKGGGSASEVAKRLNDKYLGKAQKKMETRATKKTKSATK